MDSLNRPPLISAEELAPALRLLRRTARRWRAGLVAFVVAGALAGGAYVVWPRQYRSEAVVYYQEGMQWNAGEGGAGRRAGQRLRDVLLARAQLTRIVEELGLFPSLLKAGRVGDAVEEMRLATGFRVAEGDVFVISYTGGSPVEAQKVTGRLVEVLVGENQRLRQEQAEVARAFLETERKRSEALLGEREAAQLRFLARHPEFMHDEAARSGALRARRGQEVEARVAEAEEPAFAALRREEERLRRQLGSSTPIPRAPQDPALVAARNEAETALRSAQRDLADKRANFTEQHPDVRAAEARVRVAMESYQRAAAAVDAAEPGLLRERLAEVQREIAGYRRPTAPQQRQLAWTPGGETAQRVVALEAEWARVTREVTEARDRFREIETRQFMASMTANMAAAGQAAQIIVIDPPYLPVTPLGPTRTRLLLLALLAAVGVGVGAALVAAMVDDRIQDRIDVERLGLAPVLAELPVGAAAGGAPRAGDAPRPEGAAPVQSPAVRVHHLAAPQTLDPRLLMLTAPDSQGAAAFRVLRHRLVERGVTGTLLVTSPEAGEGKSLCAANLALALGESGRARVLLLEANFRSPSLARTLGFQPPVCIAQQFARRTARAAQPWEVVESVAPWLHAAVVAPDGGQRPLIDGPVLVRFVAEMRLAGYDYIVLDSPPILGSSDVNVIEEAVDALIVTAWAGRSRVSALRAAVDQVGKKTLLGVALFKG